MNQDIYKYYAFISYSHADFRWGKRLERKLAGYKMPTTLCRARGWNRKPINPIFFAPYGIQPGDLDEELKARLRASRNLIVICSPDAAQSEWVGKEIRYFHELGRDKNIYFFIVRGEPHSRDPRKECFNPVIRELNIPEILGANIHEKVYPLPYLNRQRAYVQLVSKLLGVEFDSIWQRHKRRLIGKWILMSCLVLVIMTAFSMVIQLYKPVDIKITIKEAPPLNSSLPSLENTKVVLYYDNDSIVKTIIEDTTAIFTNISGKILRKPQHIRVSNLNFVTLDTIIKIEQNMRLLIERDSMVYGNIKIFAILPNGELARNESFVINNSYQVLSDENGYIYHYIPLSEQKISYPICCRELNVTDTIYMPCFTSKYVLLH